MTEVPDTPASFAPDVRSARVVPSPNHDERTGHVDLLLLHYTGMKSGAEALARLTDPASKVSSHYLVDEDGRIDQLVPEARRAWHAGVSAWQGVTDINSCSVGIEIVNPGHEFGYRDFPGKQIDAVIALCRNIIARHAIPPARVLAHSDVAPARKQDPGERFPWARLADSSIGLWVNPAPIREGSALKPRDRGDEVANLQRALSRFGYAADVTHVYDKATQEIVTAFQRHFRPARVDGIADASTIMTLHRLLTASAPLA
jgi:N-acetylmuramoyl-L-alanine amidase